MSSNPQSDTATILRALGYSCRGLGRTLGFERRRWSNILYVGTRIREDEARLVADYVGLPIRELFADDQVIWNKPEPSGAPSRIEIARSVAAA